MPRHSSCSSPESEFAIHAELVTPSRITVASSSLAKFCKFRSWLFLLMVLIAGLGFSMVARAQMVMDIDHEMEAAAANPHTYTAMSCGKDGAQSLPPGDTNTDLHVVGQCNADGKLGNGVYKYHWIFIHNGGALTFSDVKIDLYAASILVLNGGTLEAGSPSDNGAIGANGGQVTILLWGSKDDPAIPCEDADGKLDNRCGIDPPVWDNGNKMDVIYPTSCKPNPEDPRGDCFYQYDSSSSSNYYFGRKSLAISYGGTLRLFGKKGSTFDGLSPEPSNTGKSWRRLATNVAVEGDTFEVDGVVDWKKGDHIAITPTDYLPGHAEEAIIADVTPNDDTTEITISGVVLDNGTVQSGGLRFPHWGTKYQIPSDVQDTVGRSDVDARAAVALLSHDIRIVSEGDKPPSSSGVEPDFAPTPGNYFGGHVIFRQGFKQVEVQGVEFRQLGQGGLKGRYAVHFHMDRKVPPDTFIKDSSINESMTRWITVHATQGLLLARNVGWKSIGHGFYIEDGTETDNKIYANIGILARAGVANSENPREVPGILAHPNLGDDRDPYATDWQHPSVFWIMNGWNDFEYNMAAGAGTCGVCYWLPAAANSGPSRYQYWTGYASRQRGLRDTVGDRIYNSGTSPLEKFVGNACSTSMFSFMEIGQLNSGCDGFGVARTNSVAAIPGEGPDIPVGEPPTNVLDYYPIVTGLRDPTKCNNLDGDCGSNLDPKNLKCNGTNAIDEANCMPTVLDHYTTSFNFAQKNFSAIWLRPWWKLVTDSSITDQLGPGLTFVTGGGYTRSDSSLGNWNVGVRNVFVGQSQPTPADKKVAFFASDFGPFTPSGISECDNGKIPGGYCLSRDNGISIPITNFNAGQRMFNIYDGPSFQDSSAYLDIKARTIPDCTPENRDSKTGVCNDSQYMYGHAKGLLQEENKDSKVRTCYIPNAAIAWKQENGFYYPPAFFSKNLVFRNVDIRHFVIEPLFQLNSFKLDQTATAARYCTWDGDLFEPFNDVDRQTVLNDTDGSLTGLLADTKPNPRETLSINEDPFFRAPNVVPECSSDKHMGTDQRGAPATAITSPYEYVSTAIIADCAVRNVVDECLDPECKMKKKLAECGEAPDGLRNWTWPCTHCYGVPLFRQNWTPQDNADCGGPDGKKCLNDPLKRPGRITMMGQSTGQRSTLTANHGWYYIDTTVPLDQQKGIPLQEGRSVFLSGHTYYVYLIYGKPSSQLEYWMYVGKDADPKMVESQVQRNRVNINSQVYVFNKKADGDPDFLTKVHYEPLSGWLQVELDLSQYGCDKSDPTKNCEFEKDKENFCKPANYCSWNATTKSCGCASGTSCEDSSVCQWGTQDLDCPTKGCFGFSFKLQPSFDQGAKPIPPEPSAFPDNDEWNVPFKYVEKRKAGEECYYGGNSRQVGGTADLKPAQTSNTR